MKNFITALVIFLAGLVSVVNAASGAYSPIHIQHLKNCSPYTEIYKTQIQTGNANSPYINLESTETISGWLNGKCITKSSVRSVDLGGQEIITAKCALSKNQLASVIEKMTFINFQDDEQVRQKLQEELINFMKDSKTCNVKNYLKDESE